MVAVHTTAAYGTAGDGLHGVGCAWADRVVLADCMTWPLILQIWIPAMIGQYGYGELALGFLILVVLVGGLSGLIYGIIIETKNRM